MEIKKERECVCVYMYARTHAHLYVDGAIRVQNKLVYHSTLGISTLAAKCADKYLIKHSMYPRADVKDGRKRADALALCEENGRSAKRRDCVRYFATRHGK